MDKKTAIKVARYLAARLADEGMRVDQTILFGSCAREEANEESDVDIAIISDDFQNLNFFERAELTTEARTLAIRQFHVPIDVLRFTPDEYANSNSLAAQFARADAIVL